MQLLLSVEQICRLVKGETCLDQSFHIERIASLESATGSDVAVVFGRGEHAAFAEVEKEKIARSQAGLIIATSRLVENKKFLIVEDPLHAYTQLVAYAQQHESAPADHVDSSAHIANDVVMGDGVYIGPHVVIGAGAHIGSYVRIDANTVIEPGARIGDSTHIHANVTIGARCLVGSHVLIHSGVVIGSDGFGYQAAATGMRKIAQIGIVRIGNHVEIGAGCCIDRATFDETVIGDGVKLDNLVHIAHNVQVGPATAILAQTGIAGGTKIGAGCQIGGQVAIKDHLTLGDGVRIVSKSAVMKNVEAKQTICGIPAVNFRQWKRAHAVLNRFVEKMQEQKSAGMFGQVWHKVSGLFKE